MIVFTISNNKGGVGKTAITINLGAALARQKKRVLLIDWDSQSNLTGCLLNNVNHSITLSDLFEPSDNPVLAKDCIYLCPHQARLWVMANSIESSGLDLSLHETLADCIYGLRDKIAEHIKEFDFVLIDTPPSVGRFTAQALALSDAVIIPVDSSQYDSLEGINRVLELIDAVLHFNPNLKSQKFVINKVHGKELICKEVVNDLTIRFPAEDILKTQISRTTAMAQANRFRQTIYAYDHTRPVAREFTALAREIIGIYCNG